MANLLYGSRGDEVKKLQRALNEKGYALDVDGIFGSFGLHPHHLGVLSLRVMTRREFTRTGKSSSSHPQKFDITPTKLSKKK